jgi:hypothetical protein
MSSIYFGAYSSSSKLDPLLLEGQPSAGIINEIRLTLKLQKDIAKNILVVLLLDLSLWHYLASLNSYTKSLPLNKNKAKLDA